MSSSSDDPLPRLASLELETVFGPLPSGLIADLARPAFQAAREVAVYLNGVLREPRHSVELKSSATDMVSEVDRHAERLVTRRLARERPEDAVLGEEGTSREGSTGVRWVVDPLDGTTNYLFGIPHYSVSIAAELNGTAIVGIVIDPSRDETWAAVRGGGARLNGQPCSVATGRSSLQTALVATGFGYRRQRRVWQGRIAAEVIPAVRDLRRFGSAALDLCWVAAGRFDAYYEWGLNPWDLAAGSLICTEAGGTVEILAGRTIVAATPALWHPLEELLASVGGLKPPEGGEERHW